MNTQVEFIEKDFQMQLNLGILPKSQVKKFWATPSVCGNYNRKGASKTSGDGLATQVKSLCAVVSPVKTSQLLEIKKESMLIDQDYFQKLSGSLAFYDRKSSSWRTYQTSFLEKTESGFDMLQEKLPESGMIVGGTLYRHRPLEQDIKEKGSGLWPTPCSTDHKGSGVNGKLRDRLDYAVERGATKKKLFPTPRASDSEGGICKIIPGTNQRISKSGIKAGAKLSNIYGSGKLNPTWVEWLMGYPLGWTDLKD